MDVWRATAIRVEPLRETPCARNFSGSVNASSMQPGERVTSVRPTHLTSRSRIRTAASCVTAIRVGPRVEAEGVLEMDHVTRIRDSVRVSQAELEEDVTNVSQVIEKSCLIWI